MPFATISSVYDDPRLWGHVLRWGSALSYSDLAGCASHNLNLYVPQFRCRIIPSLIRTVLPDFPGPPSSHASLGRTRERSVFRKICSKQNCKERTDFRSPRVGPASGQAGTTFYFYFKVGGQRSSSNSTSCTQDRRGIILDHPGTPSAACTPPHARLRGQDALFTRVCQLPLRANHVANPWPTDAPNDPI